MIATRPRGKSFTKRVQLSMESESPNRAAPAAATWLPDAMAEAIITDDHQDVTPDGTTQHEGDDIDST